MNTTKEVLDNHLMCFGEGDINGILSDYSPAAILFTPDGPLELTLSDCYSRVCWQSSQNLVLRSN